MSVNTPVTIYVVHHPDCRKAEKLAAGLYDWFRLGHLTGDSGDAGLPVYYRRHLQNRQLVPDISFSDAVLNVVIVLADHQMVVNDDWRKAVVDLATQVRELRKESDGRSALLLPVAMHASFYRTGPLYEDFNPVRLLDMDDEEALATLRRAATEATARMLRARDGNSPPPLDVFLSHAKKDGIPIAECLRDSVRSFGQLVPWYDANDLPLGSEWNQPMREAVSTGTAAMVAAVTDAYPTRPWCRREATLARTPRRLNGSRYLWQVQPVLAVHHPTTSWSRGLPMLEGVPRIGWDPDAESSGTERIVDRLVLEVLLRQVHCAVARDLKAARDSRMQHEDPETCYLTWIPDTWTLTVLRKKLRSHASRIRRIVYPGYGMTVAEVADLSPVVRTFHDRTRLESYEEAWS